MARHRLKTSIRIIDELRSAECKADLKKTLLRLISAYDLEYFILASLPTSQSTVEDAVQECEWPAGWLELYSRENFSHIDPVLAHCRSSCLPVRWTDLPARKNRVMAEARDFGMKDGFSLPIYGPNGYAACLSMSGRAPRLRRNEMHILHLAASYAGERMRLRTVDRSVSVNPLTEREREVLSWAAAGKSAADIADVLAISKRTVTAHIVNAMDKLGAANKVQAVAHAMRSGFIIP